jgi:preprotein translocase subunit Sec63
MGQMENPWGELGLPRGATKLEVKEAYRKLVKEYHPDKHMNASGQQRARAEAKFKNVQEAYVLLTSNERVQVCVFVEASIRARNIPCSVSVALHATKTHACVLVRAFLRSHLGVLYEHVCAYAVSGWRGPLYLCERGC